MVHKSEEVHFITSTRALEPLYFRCLLKLGTFQKAQSLCFPALRYKRVGQSKSGKHFSARRPGDPTRIKTHSFEEGGLLRYGMQVP